MILLVASTGLDELRLMHLMTIHQLGLCRTYYASTASGIIGNIFSEHYSSIIR